MDKVALIMLAGGAMALYNRYQPIPPPVAVGKAAVPPDQMAAVPGSTPVKWSAEIANARANEIRLYEGWWLRSLQA